MLSLFFSLHLPSVPEALHDNGSTAIYGKGGRATARFYCEVEEINDNGEFLIQDLEENVEPELAVLGRFIYRVAPEEVPEWVQLGPKFKFAFEKNWQQRIEEITSEELFGDEPAIQNINNILYRCFLIRGTQTRILGAGGPRADEFN